MRYFILIIAILLLLGISTKTTAFMPNSFRWQSTALLWEDDYDLLFDPARIPLIKGSRIYTNLSNLVSYEEEQFGTDRTNFYLLGGSTDLIGFIYPGFVLDCFQSNLPLFTGLFFSETDSIFGKGTTIETEWLDLDSNGTYDAKRVITRSAEAWENTKSTDYFLGLGFKFGSFRLGASLLQTDSITTLSEPSWNSDYFLYDSSLVSGTLTFTHNDTAKGSDKELNKRQRVFISGWFDTDFFSLGLGGGLAFTNRSLEHKNQWRSYENRSPSNPNIVDYSRISEIDTLAQPYTGSIIPVSLTLFLYPDTNFESRFYLNLFTQNEKLKTGSGSLWSTEVDSIAHPGSVLSLDSTKHQFQGTFASKGFELFTRQLIKVSDRFDLGFGAGFLMRDFSDSLTDIRSFKSLLTYNNGDTISGFEDYKIVTTESDEWLTRITGLEKRLTLPVGLDFRLLPSLSFRLGARHTITWSDITTVRALKALSPTWTRTERGDGSFSESVFFPWTQPGTKENRESTTYSTTFTYGAGFNPTKNLQIDLMGFRNLTNLTFWRLSVTLKF